MDNMAMVRVIIVLLFFFAMGTAALYFCLKKRILFRESYSFYRTEGKKPGINYLYRVYDFFSWFLLTRRFLKSLTGRYEILYPGKAAGTEKKVIWLAIKIWIAGAILLAVLFSFDRSWYYALLAVFYLYVSSNSLIFFEEQRERKRLLLQFDGFLSEVRQIYQMHGMIDEAIYEAMNLCKSPIKLHAKCFYDILTDMEEEKKREDYKRHMPDRFLKSFLNLSIIIQNFGDTKVDGQSLFLTNLRYLRQEIHIEIIKRDKLQYLFSGLTLVAVLPIVFLKLIESWAVNSLPQLKNFYGRTPGILITFFLFLFTFFSYQLLITLREGRSVYPKDNILLQTLCGNRTVSRFLEAILKKNYGRTKKKEEFLRLAGESLTIKQFTLKSLIYGISGFIICIVLILFIHTANKESNLKPNDLPYATSVLSGKEVQDLAGAIAAYTRKYLEEKLSYEQIEKIVEEEGIIKNKNLQNIAAEDIYHRINSINREYFKWYEFLAAILASKGFYYIPHIVLFLLKKVRQREMEDEVFSFQSVILILMHIKRADTSIILEWMEEFSHVFKDSLRTCSISLPLGEWEALEALKCKEPFKPFYKLVEELQNSDKIGLEQAFDEVEQERANYLEKRALDNEISIQEKALLGQTIAFVPFAFTVGLYIIVPFVLEGLSMFRVYIGQINMKGG